MRTALYRPAFVCALVMMSASASTRAANDVGAISVADDPAGLHLNALMNGFRVFADAASHRFIAEDAMGIHVATPERWAHLEERLLDSTFVTLLYTYQANDGVAHARTYYAMSGSRGTVDGMRDPMLSADIDAYLDPWPGDVVASLHAQGASRVPWGMPEIRGDATWDMQDAEIKAVRSLEKDMIDGVVQKHGTAMVFISRPSCTACSQAMHNFANAYPVSVVSKEVALSSRTRPSRLQIAFLAKRVAYAATVRNSLHNWIAMRPMDLPAPPGDPAAMCLAGPPIAAWVSSLAQPERSAAKELVRAYAVNGTAAAYLAGTSDASYSRWILANPDSPYSNLAQVQLSPQTTMDAMAQGVLSGRDHALDQRGLHDMKARELGYTKVYEYSVPPSYIRGVLSQRKAGVQAGYIRSARHMVGAGRPALTALYAIALQLLRERTDATTASAQRWLGIRTGILDAVEARPTAWRPDDDDLQYLATLLDGAMHDWVIPAPASDGARRPAALFRIARMAAANHDMRTNAPETCGAAATNPHPATGRQGEPHPLCFNEATDRATYQWFVSQLRHDMDAGDEAVARMAAPFRHTIFGSAALGTAALDTAFRKEVIDMRIANRLVAEGDMTPEVSRPVIQRAAHMMQQERTP